MSEGPLYFDAAESARLRVVLPRLPVFWAVAHARSITEAASQLGMSRTAASEVLSSLEDALGCTLVHRTTRSLSLTDAGAELVELCGHMLASGSQVLRLGEWHDSEPRGVLRVSCSAGFVSGALVTPVLARMLAEHDVRVEVHTSSRAVDVVAEHFDAAVRVGQPQDSALRMRQLGETREVLVATPRWARAIAGVDDLREAPFVCQAWQPTTLELHDASGQRTTLACTPVATLADTTGLIEMLRAGAGVGVVPLAYLKGGDLAGLVRVCEGVTLRTVSAFVLTAPSRWRSAKVQRFIELLVERWQALM